MAWTYTDLSTAIINEVQSEETSFVDSIPDFIKAAESDIFFNSQIPALRKNSTGTLTSSNQYLSLPDDFWAPYSLAIISSGSQYYLLNREPDFIREAYPSSTTTGRPRYYGLMDNDTFILAPTPDQSYSVEMHYFYRPSSIVDTATSWIGTNAPNCLLYGSLIHAYIYLKGDADVMQSYRDEYLRALANLQVLTEGRVRKDTYRQMNERMAV